MTMPKDSLKDKLEGNELDLSLNNLDTVPVRELVCLFDIYVDFALFVHRTFFSKYSYVYMVKCVTDCTLLSTPSSIFKKKNGRAILIILSNTVRPTLFSYKNI